MLDNRHKNLVSAFIISLGLSSTAQAENWSDWTNISGFGSFVARTTNEAAGYGAENTIDAINEDTSFNFTRVGINITSAVSEQITFYSQLVARHEDNSFQGNFDWAFAEYRLHDSLSFRAGKLKFPVGIVNEYVDLGYAYPWIQPPKTFYSSSRLGPQALRQTYTGASFYLSQQVSEFTLSSDFFVGQVDLDIMSVRAMAGIELGLNYSDILFLEASFFRGKMKPLHTDEESDPDHTIHIHDDTGSGLTDHSATTEILFEQEHDYDHNIVMANLMLDGHHQAAVISMKVDWNSLLIYSEAAQVKMDLNEVDISFADDTDPHAYHEMVENMVQEMAQSKVAYTTIGYRFGDWLPFVSFERLEKGEDIVTDKQNTSTLGIRYDFTKNAAIKLELSEIEVDSDIEEAHDSTTMDHSGMTMGYGLFESKPEKDPVRVIGFAMDYVF